MFLLFHALISRSRGYDFRRQEVAEESSVIETKSRGEVENQPTRIYDCYFTGSSYQLSVPDHRKRDDVIGITGSDVINCDAASPTAVCCRAATTLEQDKDMICRTNETDLPSSRVLHRPYTVIY